MIVFCTCGAMMAVTFEDMTTRRAFCPSGHSTYLFLSPQGTWETTAQRRERLKYSRICEECGADFDVPARAGQANSTEKRFCPVCRPSEYSGLPHGNIGKGRHGNKVHRGALGATSPWFARRQRRAGA